MDAYYFGYDFWTKLIDGGFTFGVRAGKNIDLPAKTVASAKTAKPTWRCPAKIYSATNSLGSG